MAAAVPLIQWKGFGHLAFPPLASATPIPPQFAGIPGASAVSIVTTGAAARFQEDPMKKYLYPFATATLALFLTGALHARTWTEAASGRTLEGDLVRVENAEALIRKANGTVVRVPVEKLAPGDKGLIADLEKKAGEEAAAAEAAEKNVYKWETDFELASQRAKTEKKPMLLDFTGSDWCGWCIKLKAEVFDKKAFQKYAAENLVLVELDFPRSKKQDRAEKEQNQELAREYGIRGYPTIILLDSGGEKVGQTGYRDGGPEKYVDHLKEALADAR